MANQIALKLLNWVASFGSPPCGDLYNQDRIDEAEDYLSGHVPCPVQLTPEELAFSLTNSAEIWEAWEDLF